MSQVYRDTWIPLYQVRRIGAQFLLTNRSGAWRFLSDEEFGEINSFQCGSELIDELAEFGLVLNRDNAHDILDRWSRFNGKIDQGGPRLHIVHLTQRCNLGCAYCHSSAIPLDSKGRDLEPDTALDVAKFIGRTPSESLTVNFQGGEPTLMAQQIDDIMTYLSNLPGKRVRASLTTNGTMLDSDVLDVLNRHKISTSVSIDGPREVHNIHRVHRSGSGSFDDAVEGINQLKNLSDSKFSGSIMVLTKDTIGEVKSIIDHYASSGQEVVHLKPATQLGFGKSRWKDIGLSFDEYWDAYITCVEYMMELRDSGHHIIELQLQFALEMIFDGRKPQYVDFRNPCGLVNGVLNYDIDGKIYGCHEGKRNRDFLIGTVSDIPQKVLNSEKSRKLAASSVLDKHDECRSCAYLPFCAPCPAASHHHTKSIEIVPYEDFHCKFTLSLFDWIFEKLSNDPGSIMPWWTKKFAEDVSKARHA